MGLLMFRGRGMSEYTLISLSVDGRWEADVDDPQS